MLPAGGRHPAARVGLVAVAVALVALILVALVLVGGSAEALAAGKTYPVRLESDPEGATIYVDDQEAGSPGVTPLSLRLEAGTHTIILELANHETAFVEVTVIKQAREQLFTMHLERLAQASVVVKPGNAAAQGATILLDGIEVGVVPASLDVEPGPHQVQVVRDGYVIFEEWLESEAGEESSVTAELLRESATPPGDDDRTGASKPVVDKPARPIGPHRPRPPLFTAGAGFDVLWRRFDYEDPKTANLRSFRAYHFGAVVFDAELYPWHLVASPPFLRSLYALARLELGFPLTSTTDDDSEIDTYFRQIDLGLRYRLKVPRVTIDFDVGWRNTNFAFDDVALAAEVPDVRYQALRLSARGSMPIERFTIWLALANHIVFTGGPLADRFRSADVDGIGGNLGISLPLFHDRLELRAQGSLERYRWTFESAAGDAYVASGGTDQFYGLSLTALTTY